jgi:pimeloyl-ACP methyl ester carboxylesterase
MPVESRFVEVDGVATHVLVGGHGLPLVYLHGVAPSGEWLPVHEALARSFTVHAPDHPGFGRTERPEWLAGIDDLVLHYDELFRALELESPVLVGFSLGGWIAAELAVTYPDRIGALILISSAGLHLDEALIPDLPALQGEELAGTVFHDPSAAAEYFRGRDNPEARLQAFRAMSTAALLAWNPWFDPKLHRRLRRITCPTLCLWGEQDRLIAPAYGEAFHAAIAGSVLQTVPDAGHMLPIERPDVVAEAVTAFVRRTCS